MFDSRTQDAVQRPLKAVSLSHLARESKLGMDAPRSYLVPVLFWITNGQGRISVRDDVRGFTPHNAIYLPPNTPHACEISARVSGSAVFFGGREALPCPQEELHLRITDHQQQSEMNHMIDLMRRESLSTSPLAPEILYHRAALTLLWLGQKTLASMTLSNQPNSEDEVPEQRQA